jgi:hypothetical protein
MKPRFTIRDLFWLMVVAALVIGWRMHAASLSAAHEAEVSSLKRQLLIAGKDFHWQPSVSFAPSTGAAAVTANGVLSIPTIGESGGVQNGQ